MSLIESLRKSTANAVEVLIGATILLAPFLLTVWLIVTPMLPNATLGQQAFAVTLFAVAFALTGVGYLVLYVIGCVLIILFVIGAIFTALG